MKNRTKYLASLFLLLMGIFLVGKLVFVLYNRDIEALSAGHFLNVWAHGLLLDLRTSALLMLLPSLFCLFGRRHVRWFFVPYLIIVGIVVAVIIAADAIMYEFWEFKLCAVHLSYAASPEGTTNSVSVGFLVGRVLMIVALALLFAVPAIWLTPKQFEGKRPLLSFALMLIVALLPINVGSCYYPAPLFHCHASTNPVYRFAVSYADDSRYRTGTNEAVDAYRTSDEICDTLLRTQHPCVLFVMMESFGGKFVKELGGLPDVAPNLSRLIPEGIFWDQYYSSSFRTDRGTVCAYSGWIGYPTISPMKKVEMHPQLSSLPYTLRQEGYQSGYMYAGAMTNMGKMRYLSDIYFEALLDEAYFTHDEINSSWGANDSTSAMKLYHTLAEVQPEAHWMMVWQTISSHEPWDVPYHRLEDKRLNAFAYTDHCLGQLVDSLRTLPVWDNLLLIVIPDHGFLYEQTYDTGDFFHSPMLWLGGAIREPRRMSVFMNQSDIAATLLAQMGLSHSQFPWSRNVLAPDYEPFVYCTYPAGLFFKDSTGETLYDLTASQPIPVGQPADSTRLRKALNILNASYHQLKP